MTPAQQGAMAILCQKLNNVWMDLDAFARRLVLAREEEGAQTCREAMAAISMAEQQLQFFLDQDRKPKESCS